MNYRGLNKISLKQAGGSNAESNPRLSSLMKEIETMLNFGSDLSDIVDELMENGYDESELDEALTLYGYDQSTITDAKKLKQKAAKTDEVDRQAEMRKMAELQKQNYDSKNANSIVSYEDLDNAKRGKETDYLSKPGIYEYFESLRNPFNSGLTMTEIIEGMGPSSTMNQFFDPRYRSYHHPMSYLLPTSQPEKDNSSNLGMALIEGVTELFGGKDRDGDGVMDGVFRDSEAKRNRRLAKMDIAKMTPEEMLSNAMQYSQIDFDTEKEKYKLDPSLIDPRSISSKNKRVREAYNQSLDDRSGTSLLNFMERIQGNQDNVAAIKDQLITLPDGKTIGIDERGAMGVYDDAESNPYYYNTMMGLNQVSPVYGSPTEAPMARQNEYIYSNGIDETLDSLEVQPAELFNESASNEQQMDSQMRDAFSFKLNPVEQTPLDESIDPPVSITITEDDIIGLKEAYPDYFEDESKLTGFELEKATHRNRVKAYELMKDGVDYRPDGRESEGPTGIGFELNEQRKIGGEPLDEYQDQGEFNGPVDFPKTGVSIARVKQEKGTLTPQQEMMLGVSPGKYKPIIDWEARRENKNYNKQLKDSKKAANTPDLKYTYMYDQGTMTDNIEDFPLKGFDVGIPADSGNVNRKRLTNQVESWLSKEDRDPSKFTFTPSYDTDAEVGTPEYQNYIDMLKGRASDLGINVDWTKQKTGGESLDIYQYAGERKDQADTFSFTNAFATGAMDKMQDYYDGLEGLANEDELAALLPEAENFDGTLPPPPMLGEPGGDPTQDNLSMRDKIGNFMGNVNYKGNQMIDNFMESDFADDLSRIGTVGVNIANAFEPIAEGNRLQSRRNQMRMKRIPGMITDDKELEGTDINTGLDAQVIAGAQPTGATGYGNFYRTQDNTQMAQYGMELNSEPEDSIMDLSTEMIAKLIAAGADIEIL